MNAPRRSILKSSGKTGRKGQRSMKLKLSSPLVTKDEALFIYKGKAESVFVAGDYNSWELEDRMKRGRGDLWCLKKKFPPNARLDYKLIADGKWFNDPLNKNITEETDNSTLSMPGYRSRYNEIVRSGCPRGTLLRGLKLDSRSMEREMTYHVYLPPDYKKENITHILYAMDGTDYLSFGKTNLVLDFMIAAQEIPPLVAIFADPYDRPADYTVSEDYANYMLGELMPAVEAAYCAGAGRLDRAAIGVSWGGLTAVYLSVVSKDAFARVLSQSGSYWPRDWRIFDLIREADLRNIRYCLQAGTIEDTEEMNDGMARLLEQKGCSFDYVKYAESHRWSSWYGHLDEGLRALYAEGRGSGCGGCGGCGSKQKTEKCTTCHGCTGCKK
jgi:enterochelin esterase-like enzyme